MHSASKRNRPLRALKSNPGDSQRFSPFRGLRQEAGGL